MSTRLTPVWASLLVVLLAASAAGAASGPVEATLAATTAAADAPQTQPTTQPTTQVSPARPAPTPPPKPGPEAVLLSTHSAQGLIPVRSWKTLRDARIVKQDLDHSCGAASLATLLNAFYGQNTTEEALLKAMDIGDGMASFADMARALPQFGFKAQGFAANWEQLTRLKMPVIVFVTHRKTEHFSVLRGISGDTVWLADPSLGNRTYSREQFLEMWQTRGDKADAELAGKFLAVLPATADIRSADDFFTRTPRRQSAPAVAQGAFRAMP